MQYAGYATGGGQGDTTPYAGYAADLVLSYNIVLFDGSEVKASATENSDLFWYLRGEQRKLLLISSQINQYLTTTCFSFLFRWWQWRWHSH